MACRWVRLLGRTASYRLGLASVRYCSSHVNSIPRSQALESRKFLKRLPDVESIIAKIKLRSSEVNPQLGPSDTQPALYAFRTLIRIYKTSKINRSPLPPINLGNIQAVIDSIAFTPFTKETNWELVCSAMQLTAFEERLAISNLLTSLHSDDKFHAILGPADVALLVSTIDSHSFSVRGACEKEIIVRLANRFAQVMNMMVLPSVIKCMRTFSKFGIRPAAGDVERLGFLMVEADLSKLSPNILGSFTDLLVICNVGDRCWIDLANEIVTRAQDPRRTLLIKHNWHSVLRVARQSGQLTREVMNAVQSYFVPQAGHRDLLALAKLLFFTPQHTDGGDLAIAAFRCLKPHLDAISCEDCCILVRHLSRWEQFNDYGILLKILTKIADNRVSTAALVNLLYSLTVMKMPGNHATQVQFTRLAQDHSISATELNPRTAWLLCASLKRYRLRVVPWLQELDLFMIKNIRMFADSALGLNLILVTYGELDYPVPREVCCKLPTLLDRDDIVNGVSVLWSMWRTGDMEAFAAVTAHLIMSPKFNRIADALELRDFRMVQYQQITSGVTDYNRDLPRLPLDSLVNLARFQREPPPWLKGYQEAVASAFGHQYVVSDVVSESGNRCDLALLVDANGAVLPWQASFLHVCSGVHVVLTQNLPAGCTPFGIRVGRVIDHCIGGQVSTLSGGVVSICQSLKMEGWRSLALTIDDARRGPDLLKASLCMADNT